VEHARAADAALKAHGMIVRGMAGYGLPQCLRITIGTEDEVTRFLESLRSTLAEVRSAGSSVDDATEANKEQQANSVVA
jgi:chorismate-pyruvate lyase